MYGLFEGGWIIKKNHNEVIEKHVENMHMHVKLVLPPTLFRYNILFEFYW